MNMRPGEYQERMAVVNNELPPEARERLRELRLWHWKQCGMHRRASVNPKRSRVLQQMNEAQADFHLKQIQTLNDFFPVIGDTAERDQQKRASGN